MFSSFIVHFWLNISDLKNIAALIETGAYTREVRRIMRAIRWTIQLRKKLNDSVLSSYLNFALVPGSEVHSRLSSYITKVKTVENLSEMFK